VLRRLEIRRVVHHCAGDMGFQAAKSYDVESAPGEGSSRDLLMLELRGVPGAPGRDPLRAASGGKVDTATPSRLRLAVGRR